MVILLAGCVTSKDSPSEDVAGNIIGVGIYIFRVEAEKVVDFLKRHNFHAELYHRDIYSIYVKRTDLKKAIAVFDAADYKGYDPECKYTNTEWIHFSACEEQPVNDVVLYKQWLFLKHGITSYLLLVKEYHVIVPEKEGEAASEILKNAVLRKAKYKKYREKFDFIEKAAMPFCGPTISTEEIYIKVSNRNYHNAMITLEDLLDYLKHPADFKYNYIRDRYYMKDE